MRRWPEVEFVTMRWSFYLVQHHEEDMRRWKNNREKSCSPDLMLCCWIISNSSQLLKLNPDVVVWWSAIAALTPQVRFSLSPVSSPSPLVQAAAPPAKLTMMRRMTIATKVMLLLLMLLEYQLLNGRTEAASLWSVLILLSVLWSASTSTILMLNVMQRLSRSF